MSLFANIRLRPDLFVLLGSIAVLAAVALSLWAMPAADQQSGESEATRPDERPVTVVETKVTHHQSEIEIFAEVRPRWHSTLRAQLDGVLSEIASELQPGSRVRQGQVLASIDETAWIANLAEAENRVASAEMALLQMTEEADEARRSWRDSGLHGEPSSRLVLFEPQVDAASAELQAARAARGWVQRQIDLAKIRAPFDGIVSARHVSLGESVLPGEPIAELFATDCFELAAPISQSQWRQLPKSILGRTAQLKSPEGTGSWQATITRRGFSLNPTTRMHTLHLAVENPLAQTPPLLPGSFVTVHIQGSAQTGILELPEGALTRKGHVWYVDSDDTLRRFGADLKFTKAGRIYISEPFPASRWRVVAHPLESYMVGQKVRPMAGQASPSEGS